jgi:hypothetical protein
MEVGICQWPRQERQQNFAHVHVMDFTSKYLYKCMLACALVLWSLTTCDAEQAGTSSAVSARSGRWSDPDVWQARRLPAPGDSVVIAEGTQVQLDRNLTLGSLTVSGQGAVLSCMSNSAISMIPDNAELMIDISSLFLIETGGCFSCGAGDCQREPEPYASKLTIRLRSDAPPASAEADVRTMLVRDGGTLHLSGLDRSPAISRLASHARANDASIDVSEASGWRPGDLIAIAPTDYDPSQTEYRRIVSVSRATSTATSTLLLDIPLAYSHNGRQLEVPGSPKGAGTFVLDTRAEVALLSRNIVVEGTEGDPLGLGGDVKIFGPDARVVIKWCGLRFLGRRGQLGRYPLHLHGAADGAIVQAVAVHDSYQRGIVLHCTNNAQISDTVVASVYGFAFMLEDGAEEGNSLRGNLALDVLNAIPSTSTVITEHGNPAGFWFVNPANSFVGNMAAGIPGSGYSWEMLRNRTASYTLCPQKVPGYDVGMFANQQYSALDSSVYGALMRKNFLAFRNNSAHSMHSGIWFRGTGDQSARLFYPPQQSLIAEFMAWKISARPKAPPGVEGSHHDSCMHVFGISRLSFVRTGCVNSARVYWSSESNVLNDTLMAWVGGGDGAIDSTFLPAASADDKWWRFTQAMTSYTNPQTFLNTHVRGKYGRAVFQSMGPGSVASANTIVSGFSFDASSVLSNFDLALVSSESSHVFTDEDGGWLGAGAGARVLASCPGCGAKADPIIEAYAPGACLPVGRESSSRNVLPKEYLSDPRPASAGVIRGLGATPLLCAGPGAPRFSAIQLTVRPFSGSTSPSLGFHVFMPLGGQYLRAATSRTDTLSAFFVAPMTHSSVSAYGGYRIVSPTSWAGIRMLVVSMGPTAESDGTGMTIVLAGIPTSVRYSTAPVHGTRVNGSVIAVADKGARTPSVSCAALVAACAFRGTGGAPCVCRDSSGDLYVRLLTSPAIPDPSAYDSGGNVYLFQSPSLVLNWDEPSVAAAAAVAEARSNDFVQLAQYMEPG